jgi:hypothetical protein
VDGAPLDAQPAGSIYTDNYFCSMH